MSGGGGGLRRPVERQGFPAQGDHCQLEATASLTASKREVQRYSQLSGNFD